MVSPLSALLVASALVPSTFAFSDTSPFVAWSSSDVPALSNLKQANSVVVDSSSAYGVLDDVSLCELEGVLVMDVQGLHSSDLASIYALPAQLARAAVQVDYLVSPSAQSLDEALLRLATTCGSVIETTQEGDYTPSREMGATGVQIVKTTVEAESGEEGRTDHGMLARGLLDFLSTYPSSHLVLLTGHPSAPPAAAAAPLQVQHRRASESPLMAVAPTSSSSIVLAPTSTSGANRTDLPLLARYQILSTPILTCLIVAFGLLLPILMLGINALNSIRVPERMSATRGIIVTGEKKNQ